MLVPVKWLEEYMGSVGPIDVFGEKMIMSGSNIETVQSAIEKTEKVVVGRVISTEKHPDADKLKVCKVRVSSEEELQIVCGAPNVKENILVPVALHGAKLPNDVKIKKGKLRGVESFGMICSAKELGFEDKVIPAVHKEGIWVLPEGLTVGDDIVEALDLEDYIVDFEITPNRADCLSMTGMAREGAVTMEKSFSMPNTSCEFSGHGDMKDFVSVEIEDENLCNRYVARLVTDVKIQESPWWLQYRLMKSGVRPINNIVDITNYVMLEYGQPLHAFDMRQIKSGKIAVAGAKAGEEFVTLDGETRLMNKGDTLIKDGDRPVAIGGIMGGLNSQVEEDTETILIESANFNRDKIRKTSRALGLRTESSSRFEKGVDPGICHKAADRACQLIEAVGAGKVLKESVDIYTRVCSGTYCKVRPEHVNKVLGTDIDKKYMKDVLESLEIKVEDQGEFFGVTAPTFRKDLVIEEDYIEEIARIYGYDKLPMTIPKGNTSSAIGEKEDLRSRIRNIMTGLGAKEIETYSFVSPKSLDAVNIEEDAWERNYLRLENPLGEENSVMRTILTPAMLETLGRNYSRNIEDVFAYEIGSVFFDSDVEDEQEFESENMVVGAYGDQWDFFTMKGILEELFRNLGIKNIVFEREENYGPYHPGRCARILVRNSKESAKTEEDLEQLEGRLDLKKVSGENFGLEQLEQLKDIMAKFSEIVSEMPVEIGIMGEIRSDVAENMGIGRRAYCCELFMNVIASEEDSEKKYEPLPKYPSTSRDIALVVDEDLEVDHIRELIKSKGGNLLEEVKLFDIYRGKQVEDGKKSVAFSLRYRNREQTITDEEVSVVHNNILKVLEEQFNAVLRDM